MINNSLVEVKDQPCCIANMERPVLLNPMACAKYDSKTCEYSSRKLAPLSGSPKSLSTVVASDTWSGSPADIGWIKVWMSYTRVHKQTSG